MSEISCIGFIGGGNMATAIIGGLVRDGLAPAQVEVIEPFEEARKRLAMQFGLVAKARAGETLARCDVIVWAVKPQTFREAASQAAPHVQGSLHLSVAAGIRSGSIAGWLGSDRVVRAMPNTPALVGKGITALFARSAVTQADRGAVERVIRTTGDWLWVDEEQQLDAVTALSGSGPAYVFFYLEAMTQAGIEMGLSREQAYKLSVSTFSGAAALAASSDDPPELLRERVTSKGGTTYAAITSMEQSGMKDAFVRALHKARVRAQELGDEFGA